jgi:hypothetical protein
MPGTARWAYYRPRAYAEVNGVETEVVKLVVNFELNTVSSGTIVLPVGRAVQTQKVAAIHGMVADLAERTPVKVYAYLEAVDRSDESVRSLPAPSGRFLLFDGFAVFGNYSRATRNATYQLTLVHWMAQLGEGSCFSYSSHPSNPAQYSFGSIMPVSDGSGAKPDWTALTQSDDVNAQTLGGDLWGDALYKWFGVLASRDLFAIWERDVQGDGTNNAARAALERLKPGGKHYVPLALNQQAVDVDVDLADAIATDFNRSLYPGQLANQTFWDMLVGRFAADYSFAVVPRAADGLVVPFIPGFRGEAGKAFADILADEQVGSETSSAMPRPLRGYGILSGIASRAGTNLTPGDGPSDADMGVGGYYAPEGKKGAVMIGQAPAWLASMLSPSLYGDDASGAFDGCGSALHPGEGRDTGARDGIPAKGRKIKSALDAYARCRYAQEVLKGRSQVVSGVFRVDIAPGSLVRVEGASEKFLGDYDGLAGVSFGQVLRVTLVLDAETPAAGTAFHVGFVRSEAENGRDATSIDAHPLYKQAFSGCPLVDA